MELKQSKYKIKVIGDEEYLDVDDMTITSGKYRYQDSVSLSIIVGLDHNNTTIGINYFENLHGVDEDRYTVLETTKDGLYKILYYVFPTIEWVERANPSNPTYYYNDGKYYLRENGEDTLLNIDNILDDSDLQVDERVIFMDYFIKRCFGEIVKKTIDVSKDCHARNLEELKIHRDLIHMFINVIQYSLEFGKMLEAQLYIEKFAKCNTICNKHISSVVNYDCGCR